MGFYLRKSVRVGPLRFNLSKSGIGVSTGIPGFRVGTGPRGNYVHMGRGGLYYRKSLSPRTQPAYRRTSPPVNVSPGAADTVGPMTAIGSACVSEMVDANSAGLLEEIDRKRRRVSIFPFTLFLSVALVILLVAANLSLWITVPIAVLLVAMCVCVHQYDQLQKGVVIMYELEDSMLESFRGLYDALGELARCSAIWHVTAKGQVHDSKYHAGAGHLINRQRFSVRYCDPPHVVTNVSVPCLAFGSTSFYLLPDRILVLASNSIGAIDYRDVSLKPRTTRFIEDGAVPRDANVVDQTWQYVNKSGGPDRRFKNNRQLPICQYEELEMSSTSGMHEVLQLSRVGVSRFLEQAIATVIKEIRAAEAAEVERQRLVEQRASDNDARFGGEVATYVDEATAGHLNDALFDLLCCIMVADGRATGKEKATIRQIMSSIDSDWRHETCDARLDAFIASVRNEGFGGILDRSLARTREFVQHGRQAMLLRCLEMVANADGDFSQRERQLCDRIRQQLLTT